MTHRHGDEVHDDHAHDETRVVDRERVYEREPQPAQPAGSQVNVNSGRGYAATPAGPGPLYYAKRVVSLLFGILFVLIAIRIVLLLLAANEGNALVDSIYAITEPFVAPFRGIFAIDQVTPNGTNLLDVAAVVALIGWLLIYLLIMAILGIADRDRAYA